HNPKVGGSNPPPATKHIECYLKDLRIFPSPFLLDEKSRAIADPAHGAYIRTNNYFTAAFKAFPAANLGTLLAAISISSPV
ncbi:hypothetical protein, partial [Desulfobacula sp.]|uniref:hypothetical protein n=1 Tax=Desulfobacula sp. TaxID=2593537 RepID=UPI0039B9992D